MEKTPNPYERFAALTDAERQELCDRVYNLTEADIRDAQKPGETFAEMTLRKIREMPLAERLDLAKRLKRN